MPKCFSCNKTFKDWQALGNYIRKHQDNSNDDLPSPSQTKFQILSKKTSKVFNNRSISREQNVLEKMEDKTLTFHFSTIQTLLKAMNLFDTSNSHSNIFNNEFAISDLSDMTNTDVNEFTEYNNLIARKPKGSEDIY
ncbi:22012_t:CDS:2 [Cetraspora pellucida]|uniref:22012_t:CDS:1 n=1 Tax=Cetraspora pellucida TaxID=1433469 RepID=A0A9N9IZS5_9GLOM|nr:22012_t:CDS:2 [Cetraspora pellucida]